jgi:transposase
MIPSVGVDVSKDHLDWASSARSVVERIPNRVAGIRRLVRALRELQPERIVVEATGGYERALVEALARAGLPVVVVNPWRVRRFGEGMGALAKTDRIDAQLLALFGERARPTIRPLLRGPEAALIARRRQLVEMLVAERNRLGLATRAVRRDIASLIRILERRIARLDRQIDSLLEADPERQETAAILQSAPSVGPGVARSLLVDLPELGRLSPKQIASLAGLAPFARDSGRKKGQRSVRAGRAAPRTALYLAAMNGARFNPVLRRFYERLRAAGKPPKLAFVALARKLLTILNAMVRDRTTWRNDPLHA